MNEILEWVCTGSSPKNIHKSQINTWNDERQGVIMKREVKSTPLYPSEWPKFKKPDNTKCGQEREANE